jgi:hypothetical protein
VREQYGITRGSDVGEVLAQLLLAPTQKVIRGLNFDCYNLPQNNPHVNVDFSRALQNLRVPQHGITEF